MSHHELIDVLGPFLALIVLVVVGMWAKQRRIITNTGQTELTNFVLDVSMPVLVFASTAAEMTQDMLLQAPLIMLASVLIILLGFGAARIAARFLKLETQQRIVFELETAFPNTGFLGIPVNALLFGSKGALIAILCDLGLTLLFFSFSSYILQGRTKNDWKKTLLHPINIGLVAGLMPPLLGWQIPSLILEPLRLLGNMSIPVGLLLVGLMAIPITLRPGQKQVIGWTSFLRLLAIPALIMVIVRLANIPNPVGAVIVLEAAMPAFASGPILAQKYGADHQLAASTTVISTLLSTVTLPLFALLML